LEAIRKMLEEIKAGKKLSVNKIVVGVLKDEIVKFLEHQNIPIHTKEIYLTHKGLSHLARDTKQQRGAGLSEEDILRIPEIIKSPSAVLFDSKKNKLNLLYCNKAISCEKFIKIVIDTKSYDKKLGKITLIKTAGYIVEANLKNKYYIPIEMGGR